MEERIGGALGEDEVICPHTTRGACGSAKLIKMCCEQLLPGLWVINCVVQVVFQIILCTWCGAWGFCEICLGVEKGHCELMATIQCCLVKHPSAVLGVKVMCSISQDVVDHFILAFSRRSVEFPKERSICFFLTIFGNKFLCFLIMWWGSV